MKKRLFNHSSTQTPFILLNTGKCKACWKCVDSCHKQVIGRIEFLWHKHVKINFAERCTGCLKCVKICEHGAYIKREENFLNVSELIEN